MLFFSRFKKAKKTKKDEGEEDIIDTLNGFMKQRMSTSKTWQTLKEERPRLYGIFGDLLTSSLD